jgi:hypothetical protein
VLAVFFNGSVEVPKPMIRPVLAAMCAVLCLLFAAPAGAFQTKRADRLTVDTLAAPQVQPLTGEGENLQLVANVPIDPGTQGVAASDLELFGNYAFVGSYGEGVVIVDISDPTHPRRVGKFSCPGGQNDIQLSPDGRYLALAVETTSNKCHPSDEGTAILDISDPTSPVEIAWIGQDKLVDGSHNNTLDWPYLYVDQYTNTYSKLEIFDLSTPSKPKKVGGIDYGGQDSHHDLIVDHRPDGKSFAYAASINFSDVIDVTDVTKPVLRERIRDPQVTISHQAEPNFDRSLLLVTDEFGGGAAGPGCGGNPAATVPGSEAFPPQVKDPASIGALHMYKLDKDGTIAGENGLQKAGVFNIPYTAQDDPEKGCTIHVFWQAPDQNRLVTAWYGRGTRVVDFSNPALPKQLAWFIPTGGDTWSAKPHNGYIYSGDIVRGLDIFKYTGEGGAAWPATAGAAEQQRARQQGWSSPTSGPSPTAGAGSGANATAPADGRAQGRRSLRLKVRVPDRRRSKRATLVISFNDRAGRLVSRVRQTVRDNGKRSIRASIGGLAGRYRYSVRLGDRGRILKRGSFVVKRQPGASAGIRSDQALVCQIIKSG